MAHPSCTVDDRDAAYGRAVPHRDIVGLYSGFQSAATILRIAKSLHELDASVVDPSSSSSSPQHALDNFFETLDDVERQLILYRSENDVVYPSHPPFVVAVEGIDGSGKSSVVQELASRCNGMTVGDVQLRAVGMGTPTESLASVRPVFDKRGGSVARAFYMVSNYVLQHEIRQLAVQEVDRPLLVLVDRWYGSTLSYSTSWKNTNGGPETIDKLFEESPKLFSWPLDLDPPHLMIVLDVDADVRKARVSARNQTTLYNPWDGRLNDDDDLGRRIMRCFQLLTGPRETVKVDANPPKADVIAAAFALVSDRIKRHAAPFDYWSADPTTWFCWESSQLGLCDFVSRRRRKHAPWAIQVASAQISDGDEFVAPSLRTVGVHSADRSGIVFFTWGSPGGGMQSVGAGGMSTPTPTSVVCLLGDYPYEQQWRGEGVTYPVSALECELLELEPPPALCSHIGACRSVSLVTQESVPASTRLDRTSDYATQAAKLYESRKLRKDDPSGVQCYRFVALRMEVLVGGPSSPQGPRRYEWSRGGTSKGWTSARSILPFTAPGSVSGLSLSFTGQRCFTLALTGTHCAGKATIGRKVAEILGWRFDPELGEVLRECVIPGGHRTGYGTDAVSWDQRVLDEELNRDASATASRVVETWHVGNLAWALWRRRRNGHNGGDVDETDPLTREYVDAVRKAAQNSVVLQVYLSTVDGVAARRRAIASNAERLPMESDAEECRELHAALEGRALKLVQWLQESSNDIPTLVIDNSRDGESAQREVVQTIVRFVNENLWSAHQRPS